MVYTIIYVWLCLFIYPATAGPAIPTVVVPISIGTLMLLVGIATFIAGVVMFHIQWKEWQSACRSSATIEKSSVLPYKELPQPSCASEIKEITPCGAIPITHFTVLWSLYFEHVCALDFRLFGL